MPDFRKAGKMTRLRCLLQGHEVVRARDVGVAHTRDGIRKPIHVVDPDGTVLVCVRCRQVVGTAGREVP